MLPWHLIYFPIGLIKDIYWCFIPNNCRKCHHLKGCRKGFWKLRKCYNGCIKYKILSDGKKEEDRIDYINNLVGYVEDEIDGFRRKL
ncbi:MAG: hypothetical protein IKB70_13710 [Bacilli bacterium]|nr:hypothetical protein [Bacilli bacterium]